MDDEEREDDIILMLEVNEKQDEYRLTVKSASGAPLLHEDFLLHLELYLNEATSGRPDGEVLH